MLKSNYWNSHFTKVYFHQYLGKGDDIAEIKTLLQEIQTRLGAADVVVPPDNGASVDPPDDTLQISTDNSLEEEGDFSCVDF